MTRRRSKVRSKTRSDSSQKSEDEILYCICRSSDGTRFMIACDNCEEWYHGDCINVTPKQANNIKRFFCHLCIGRNPSLEIEYKTTKENRPRLPNLRQQIKKINFSSDEENDADLSSSSSPDKSLASNKSKRATRKRWRPSISESVGKKRRGRPKERQDDYDDEATEDEIETSGFPHSIGDCVDDVAESAYIAEGYRAIRHPERVISKRGQSACSQVPGKTIRESLYSNYNADSSKWCGVCIACKRTTDCGQCDNCRRYGTRNICRRRMCVLTKFGNQSVKPYHKSKDYGTLIDDDLDCVLDDSEYHNQPTRRRGGTGGGGNDFGFGEVRQRLNYPPVTTKDTCAIGSKMRRGDHLPGGGNSSSHRRSLTNVSGGSGMVPYKCQGGGNDDDDSLDLMNGGTSYRYHQSTQNNNRLSKNNQPSQPGRRARNQSNTATTTQMSSNTSSVSGGQMSSQQYPYVEESEEDVMIPGELISPTNGQRIEESDARHYSSYQQQRSSKTTVTNEIKYHYGLNYPDHLYCKHHRSYDWHGNIAGASGGLSSSSEAVIMVTASNASTASANNARVVEPSSIMKSDKDIDLVHARLRSPSLDQQLSPSNFMVLERTSTKTNNTVAGINAAAINAATTRLSSSSDLRYGKMKATIAATSLPTISQSSSSSLVIDRHDNVVPAGDAFVNLYGGGDSGQSSSSLYQHHRQQQHQIIDLNQPMTSTEIGQHKSSSSSSQLLLGTQHLISAHNNNNNITNSSNSSTKEPLPHSISVFMKSSLANTTQQQQQQQQQQISQEFYTINDEDDLEINWPKETVNA